MPFVVLTCPLSDIDHLKSFLGQRLSRVLEPVIWAFGHRGFTYSLLAVFGMLTLFYLEVSDGWTVPADALQDLVPGYLSHILTDMFAPAGVPLLRSCCWRFRLPILAPRRGNQLEYTLCVALFVYVVWMSQTLVDDSAIC